MLAAGFFRQTRELFLRQAGGCLGWGDGRHRLFCSPAPAH